jgi:transposase-like protein
MSVSEGKFGRKKEEAIVALMSQRSVDDAARSANVNPRTLYRWMREPEFDIAYRAAKRAAYGQSIARLHQASSAAVTTLLKLMVDQNVPASTRARCADSILAHTAKAIELEDFGARLSAVECATEETQKKK